MNASLRILGLTSAAIFVAWVLLGEVRAAPPVSVKFGAWPHGRSPDRLKAELRT